MNLKIYDHICILVNEARYSDEQRVRDASRAVGQWLRTTPLYGPAMRAAAAQLDQPLSGMQQKEFAALGGKARAKKLSQRRRKEIARDAVKTRWANTQK